MRPATTKKESLTKGKTGKRYQRNKNPVNKLNDLTSKEWVAETVSVWVQRGLGKNHKNAQIEREHPAPFSYQDVARLIRFFTKRGQTVLDPFVGVGSTLKAAALESRRGIGIELNPKYAKLAKKRLKVELEDEKDLCLDQTILKGDAAKLIPTLNEESVELVVTSPPYWKILHKEDHKAKQERINNGLDSKYSDHPDDLGNIESYPNFLNKLTDILALCYKPLKTKGHMCVVVSDFRDKSKYYMLHADLANRLEKRNFCLKGVIILHQRHKKIFPYGYPYAYVPNIHHQYVLVFRKND